MRPLKASFLACLLSIYCATGALSAAEVICEPSVLDLVFVIDKSDSIGAEEFNRAQELAVKITQMFTIGHGMNRAKSKDTRVGYVDFSSNGTRSFSLPQNSLAEDVIKSLKSYKFTGGETKDIAEALTVARRNILRDREFTHPMRKPRTMIILMSDGHSTSSAFRAQQAAEAVGIEIYAIALGDDINMDGLRAATGDNMRVYLSHDVEALMKSIVQTCYLKDMKPPGNEMTPVQDPIFQVGPSGVLYSEDPQTQTILSGMTTAEDEGPISVPSESEETPKMGQDVIDELLGQGADSTLGGAGTIEGSSEGSPRYDPRTGRPLYEKKPWERRRPKPYGPPYHSDVMDGLHIDMWPRKRHPYRGAMKPTIDERIRAFTIEYGTPKVVLLVLIALSIFGIASFCGFCYVSMQLRQLKKKMKQESKLPIYDRPDLGDSWRLSQCKKI